MPEATSYKMMANVIMKSQMRVLKSILEKVQNLSSYKNTIKAFSMADRWDRCPLKERPRNKLRGNLLNGPRAESDTVRYAERPGHSRKKWGSVCGVSGANAVGAAGSINSTTVNSCTGTACPKAVQPPHLLAWKDAGRHSHTTGC